MARRGGNKPSAKSGTSPSELLSAAVAHHQAGRVAAAERLYKKVLRASPGDGDALHFLGLIAHQRGDHAAALTRLDAAIASRPQAAPFHNNRGSVLLALGRAEDAAASYRSALALDAGYVEALSNLGGVLVRLGEADEAVATCHRALALAPSHAEAHNNLGSALKDLGDAAAAEAAFRAALKARPGHADAHLNLGNVLQEQGDLEGAEAAYREALAVRPGHAETLCNLGRALETLGRLAEAVDSHQAAITERPDFARAHVELGNVLQVKGENALSEVAYRQALDVEPSFVAAFAGLADLYEKTSRLDEADRAASEVIDREPDNVLANVVAAKCARRRGRPEAGLDRLRALDQGNLDPPAKSAVCFEMGRLLDRLGDADEAYSCFVEGNRLNAEHARIGADEKESYPRLVRQLADTFTENWVNSWTPPVAETRPAPIFLIGFPRSGTTLLDQVLDSHPRLVTLEERPTVDAVVAEVAAMAGGYPGALATLSSEQINRLRELYFGVVDNHLESPLGDAVLVDKMPLNTVDAGLIHRLFPSARFILSLRHPCDVVLSGFMQAFRPNPAMVRFSTLADTASLYGQVMDLWGRYVDALRLVALPVRYENLVTDLEGEARRVLAFLDLEWDDAVLDYADRAREKSIATPSYHQVVQPIYKSSVGRWTQYRPQLEPVLPILRPACEMFGYALADRS